jgi:hypothetical protein
MILAGDDLSLLFVWPIQSASDLGSWYLPLMVPIYLLSLGAYWLWTSLRQ